MRDTALKILLSAYACEPNKGSEPGVGWNWAMVLAQQGHEVWVITRANNQASIEQALGHNAPVGLHFVYYDLPTWAKWWKKGPSGVYVYYLLWQWGAYRTAQNLVQTVAFDWVHHVTFVSIRQPSFMGLLELPFVFGPVAGGEKAPWRLRQSYPLKGWLIDGVRDLTSQWVRFDPLMYLTFAKATKIFVTSEQTQSLLLEKFRMRSQIQLAIGTEPIDYQQPSVSSSENTDVLKILFVGRLIYWKGLHLGLQAFSQLQIKYPNVHLTIIGDGPDKTWLQQLATKLELKNVDWVPWLPQAEVTKAYPQHQIFLYPSLHDSGGMVVLEALSYGLPVVCLDLGGPGIIVDSTCGFSIKTDKVCESAVIESLSQALETITTDADLRYQLGKGAQLRCQTYQWGALSQRIYAE